MMMKKLLSVLLMMTLIASLLVIAPAAETDYSKYVKIGTEAELLNFLANAENIDDGQGNFVLTADITLNSAWTMIEWFDGTLDGNGHKITLTQQMNGPMFDMLDMNSVVKNLLIDGMNVSVNENKANGLATTAAGLIKNVTVENAVIVGSGEDTALIYENNGTISGVTVSGSVSGGSSSNRAGGIVSKNQADGVIRYCKNYADVTAGWHVGGIASTNLGKIECCINYGDITSTQQRTGGIAASNSSNSAVVINCGNYGTITSQANSTTSGIGAGNSGNETFTFENCFNAGKVISLVTSIKTVGGITGFTKAGTIKNCYSLKDHVYLVDTNIPYSDAEVEANTSYGSTNGILVSLDEFASAEMITKLGSAFVLTNDATYPIDLAADTATEPMPEIKEDETEPETEPVTDPETEPVTDPETEPETDHVTEAPTDTDPVNEEEGGCGSMIGGVSVAFIAMAAIVPAILFKKKEE